MHEFTHASWMRMMRIFPDVVGFAAIFFSNKTPIKLENIPGPLLSYILFFLEDTSRRDNRIRRHNRRRRNSSAANLAKKLTALRMTCKACNNVAVIEKAALFHIESRKTKVMEALKRQHIEDLFDDGETGTFWIVMKWDLRLWEVETRFDCAW